MSRAIITVDLGHGDSGKGTVVDTLTRVFNSGLNVRFNGGSQCGHNVVDNSGTHHEFAQFASGTFAAAKTLLSKYVLVNPLDMMLEAESLKRIFGFNPILQHMFVDERALVTTPYHSALNRIREMARTKRNGSCGRGIRETVVYAEQNPNSAIRIKDLTNYEELHSKLAVMNVKMYYEVMELAPRPTSDMIPLFDLFKQDVSALARRLQLAATQFNIISPERVADMINSEYNVIFEAAQGILLDQHHGFRPHITKSTCTNENAFKILDEVGFDGERFTLGIARTYMTKHGPGPFPTEDAQMTASLKDSHNFYNQWQRDFRVGFLDIVALKYAIECTNGIDGLAITHKDISDQAETWKVGIQYQCPDLSTYHLKKTDGSRERQEALTREMKQVRCNYAYTTGKQVPSFMESALGAPLILTSEGKMAKNKKFVRDI